MKSRALFPLLFLCLVAVSAPVSAGGDDHPFDSIDSRDAGNVAHTMIRRDSRSSDSSLGHRRYSLAEGDTEIYSNADVIIEPRQLSPEEQELFRPIVFLPTTRYASQREYRAHLVAEREAQRARNARQREAATLPQRWLDACSPTDALRLVSIGFLARSALHGCAYALGMTQTAPGLDHAVSAAFLFWVTG